MTGLNSLMFLDLFFTTKPFFDFLAKNKLSFFGKALRKINGFFNSITVYNSTLGKTHMKLQKKYDALASGSAAAVVITILAFLTLETSSGIWIMFSFGATVFLVFALYDLDTAQPKNIFFGHLISIIVGIIFNETMGLSFISLGLSVGIAVILMIYFKVMHPPAASNPLVALFMDLSFDYILFPVIAGTIVIILLSVLINRLVLKRNYPKYNFNLIKK